MPSHLTRLVFRKLIANELRTYHGCLRQSGLSRRPATHFLPTANSQHGQRRTFFNLFRKPEREIKEADIDPGLEKMIEYSKMERLGARLPPVAEMMAAFSAFMDHRKVTKTPMEDEHAKHALRTFHYITRKDLDCRPSSLTLIRVLGALRLPSKQPSEAHAQLALDVGAEWATRCGGALSGNALYQVVKTLCAVGKTSVAREYLEGRTGAPEDDREHVDQHGVSDDNAARSQDTEPQHLWRRVLVGFIKEGNEDELLRTLSMMGERGLSISHPSVCSIMCAYYADSNNTQAAKEWHERLLSSSQIPEYASSLAGMPEVLYPTLLGLCIREKDTSWGQSLIKEIVGSSPSKELWDWVLIWAASLGKGVDEIDRMIGVMERSMSQYTPGDERRTADIETINKLVDHAISNKDPYTAERFIEMGKKRKIVPNAQTLVLQMDYRLSVADVDGALVAYKHLQTHDLAGMEDVPTVNMLICAMCGSGRHDFESIMGVAADLSDRRARFTPATVSTLCILHLSRGELHDVIDLLNTQVFHYSSNERASVRNSMVDFCLRTETSTSQAWDTYAIVREIFDEMKRDQRTRLMEEFFRRSRPDMAVHVFNHMRTHSRSDTLATVDTYVLCLRGVARLQDEESLDAVHNQLKLDYSIEPSTRLSNALMLAYTACDRPRRALEFWDDIASSSEGPKISSIHLAFRACEKAPWGDKKARAIWSKLQKTGIEFDQKLWASYMGALVGNGDVSGSISELGAALSKHLVAVDTFIVGSLFNAAPGQAKQTEVEDWAKHWHPDRWAELEAMGIDTTNIGMRCFPIDRKVDL